MEYSRYDINRYHFRTEKLEASHPLTATTNSGLVITGEDATSHVTDYYNIFQNIVEYTFGGAKELKVVFFQCDWFDSINDTRVDGFGMGRSSMNHAIQGAVFCLHIRCNRCTT
jgi:hypothetical protein